MRYFIYIIIMIMFFIIGHLNNAYLLADAETNAGHMGEYIGGVILFPFLLPAIIYGIVMLFSKTKKVSFIYCSNWVVGLFLLSNIAKFMTNNTPTQITFPVAKITVIAPDHTWKLIDNNQRKILISRDTNVFIGAERHSQDKIGIHTIEDITQYSRNLLGGNYDEDTYRVYPCEVKNYQCGFQSVAFEKPGKENKQVVYAYLIDKTSVVILTAVISEANLAKDYETFQKILRSATNTAQ